MSRLGHGKGYYDRFLSSYQSCITARHDPRSVRRPILCKFICCLYGWYLLITFILMSSGTSPNTASAGSFARSDPDYESWLEGRRGIPPERFIDEAVKKQTKTWHSFHSLLPIIVLSVQSQCWITSIVTQFHLNTYIISGFCSCRSFVSLSSSEDMHVQLVPNGADSRNLAKFFWMIMYKW